MELLREEVTRCYVDVAEIEGGMDRLPGAFVPGLRPRIRFGARMIALDQDERSATVHYQTTAGRFKETGDHVLVTVPFAVLRHVEILKPFSPAKQRAIRQLHYDASDFQLIQAMLADCAVDIAVNRAYTHQVAWEADSGVDRKTLHAKASVAKLSASEAAGRVVDRCLQIFGGRGYDRA